MSLKSILSAGSVVGGAAIVVSDAEASLRMLQSLKQSEEEAKASYKVNLEALQNQCHIVDDRLKEEEDKVKPVEEKLEGLNEALRVLDDKIYAENSKINDLIASRSGIPTCGESDEESAVNQKEQDRLSEEIREAEELVAGLKEEADSVKREIEDTQQFKKEVDENMKTLTTASIQVHQETNTYETEGAIAIERIKDEAEQNERVCRDHHDLSQELLASRQHGR